jgi:predicted RecB family endonuclease
MEVHGFMGVDVPVRDRYGLAHYEVGVNDLAQAYVILKVFGVRGHVTRRVAPSPFRLTDQGGAR